MSSIRVHKYRLRKHRPVSTMPIHRSAGRNVQFYDARSPGDALGGLIQNGSVTEANFLEMLGILLSTETPIRVQERGSGHIVMKTNRYYDVYCDSKC